MRSTPLMTKVPCGVIHGKSARNISCSFSSPVVLFLRRTTIESGDSYVFIARFAYCSSQRNSPKLNLTSLSSNFLPEWSEMGENSLNTRSAPPATKSWNDFYLCLNEGGKFHQGLAELSEVLLRSHRFEFRHNNKLSMQRCRRRIKKLLNKRLPRTKTFY